MRSLSTFGFCSTFVSGLLVATVFAGCFPQLPPEDVGDSTTNGDASLPADTEALLDTLLTEDTATSLDTSGPVCVPPCTQGGTCTAPNVCDCAVTGYTGATCEIPVCTTPCANGGSCTAPNSCYCAATGYTGSTCETPVCTTPCANGGSCTAPNTCHCAATGYTGSICETPVCTTPCANGGSCSAPNVCTCTNTGYTGSTCQTPVCTTPCANGGLCTAPNVCTCTGTGYTGSTCQTLVCGPTACPALPGYTPTCNGRAHCEYARTSPTATWHADDVWIYVPAGSFLMGAPTTEAGSLDRERPVHTVGFAQGFFIGKYEVTARTYEACEGDASCTLPSVADWDGAGWGLNRTSNSWATHPQNGVIWAQAGAVCAWLGGRRPSEAEWEYAAKGPTTHRKYPWGDGPEPTCANGTAVWNEAGTTANYGCGTGGTWPAGQKAAGLSAVGALDMAGNLWEWVEDCWHGDYTGAPSNGLAWTANCIGSLRMARGGSFFNTAPALRGAYRYNDTPTYRFATYGARCLRPLP